MQNKRNYYNFDEQEILIKQVIQKYLNYPSIQNQVLTGSQE